MECSDLGRIVAAHDYVWEGWWPTLIGLTLDQTHQTVVGSFPSVFVTVTHLVVGEWFWQGRLEGRSSQDVPVHPRDMKQLEAVWREVQQRRNTWLQTADPLSEVRFETVDGENAAFKAWECVLHVVTHAHFHRGQLVAQVRQLSLAPPSRHFVGHFMNVRRFRDHLS